MHGTRVILTYAKPAAGWRHWSSYAPRRPDPTSTHRRGLVVVAVRAGRLRHAGQAGRPPTARTEAGAGRAGRLDQPAAASDGAARRSHRRARCRAGSRFGASGTGWPGARPACVKPALRWPESAILAPSDAAGAGAGRRRAGRPATDLVAAGVDPASLAGRLARRRKRFAPHAIVRRCAGHRDRLQRQPALDRHSRIVEPALSLPPDDPIGLERLLNMFYLNHLGMVCPLGSTHDAV